MDVLRKSTHRHLVTRLQAAILTVVVGISICNTAWADGPRVVRAEAVSGQPYGVGKITFEPTREDDMVRLTHAFSISERRGRLLYPVFSHRMVEKILDRAEGAVISDSNVTVWFLFLGDQPLEIELSGMRTTRFEIKPTTKRANAVARRVKQWWREYNRIARSRFETSEYPPLVETYLTSMLSRRLQLQLPASERGAQKRDALQKTLDLLLDTETLRTDMIRQMMMSDLLEPELARSALPKEIEWKDDREFAVPENVEVEPIAKYVPEECFYLRFGTWQNQLWLKRLMAEYGGDLGRMVQLRSYRSTNPDRMLEQLVLESNELQDAFAGNAIADLAVIGMDAYTADGAAIGVLFHAKNKLFERSQTSNRKSYARKHAKNGVTLKEVAFGKNKGTLLSSPDNHVRSFLVSSGQFHLVTTSHTLASRFFAAANGERSLASNRRFRLARSLMPTDRDDTVFIYVSSEFFKNLLSPHYQIELFRRHQSIVRFQLLELAQMAARNEGYQNPTIAELIEWGFLPRGFERLSDGSRLVSGQETIIDSLRGRRGLFVPIPDLPVVSASDVERAWFNDRAEFFSNQFQEIDPLLVALKRFGLNADVERIVMDARVAPFGQKKYEWLGTRLGEPMRYNIVTPPTDIVSVQASLQGGGLFNSVSPHQIFVGIQNDTVPDIDLAPTNFLKLLRTVQSTPGYVGAWPNPGYLDVFGIGHRRMENEDGLSYSRLLKVWRMQHREFSVISFDDQRLKSLKRHLRVEEAKSPAQIRIQIGDLAASNLRDWANAAAYGRSWQASVGNMQLVNAIIGQLGVPPKEALQAVQRLLEVELICPLGGNFELIETDAGRQIWVSDKWPSLHAPKVPEDFEAPVLSWFRGANIEVKQVENQFAVHAVMDVHREAEQKASAIPGFQLFKGFGKVETLPPVKGTPQKPSRPAELNPPIK